MAHGPSKPTASDNVKTSEEHQHTEQLVYPTLADPITVTAHANDWVLGTITEIVPASTITEHFDIHEVSIETVSVKDKTFELVLYYGATDIECGRSRFSSATNKGGVPNGSFMTPIIPANSRIRAQLAVQDGGGQSCTISIRYHVY